MKTLEESWTRSQSKRYNNQPQTPPPLQESEKETLQAGVTIQIKYWECWARDTSAEKNLEGTRNLNRASFILKGARGRRVHHAFAKLLQSDFAVDFPRLKESAYFKVLVETEIMGWTQNIRSIPFERSTREARQCRRCHLKAPVLQGIHVTKTRLCAIQCLQDVTIYFWAEGISSCCLG